MSKCEQCIIKQFNSLKTLSKEELVRISNCKISKVIKKGAVIFEEGEILGGVYCVRDGICKLTKLSSNGKDQIVKMVVKGDLLGQRSVVTEERSNLQATALNDMEVCFIPKNEILKYLHKNPEFTFDVLKSMANDLREADDIIVNMAQKSVRQRLAETLIYIHDSFGENPDGTLSVLLSREDLANIVGTATESAIRVLSQFKKEGLIATIGKQIKIKDLEGLKRVE
ncbi:Crp/Fnr family transcriptional regulator [Pseudalgibacter alginicilyticus]|uniref:Crp/Fnr family transcriptional regulator n=1 Tax=Pseudalgibacter alginicilyticus TaxID=1736674 RepID=A0A0P0D4F7_9FLAO|nr:Crp/Fnr family transcriptional regulator [Pseudalgibacter alginicilyticus]ALJ05042.1 Crp/Fnr family transcriptional regulator [Pseudalgibacter alginicilyticus]